MEYVYAAMLLHAAEKDIDEKAVGAVLKAAGVKADDARVKALVASLDGVDISEAMTQAVAAPAAASAPAAGAAAAADAPAAEEEVEEEEAGGFDGLGSLFG
jgi:large subunit ribosomal protein L12